MGDWEGRCAVRKGGDECEYKVLNWEGRWTDGKEERCVSRGLRKAGESKGAFAAKGVCVKKASTICNSLVKKIDCLNCKNNCLVC